MVKMMAGLFGERRMRLGSAGQECRCGSSGLLAYGATGEFNSKARATNGRGYLEAYT